MQQQEPGEQRRASQKESYKTIREAVEQGWFPLALSIGVAPEQFFKLTPVKLTPYIKAHEIRQRAQLEQVNFQSWMMGVYFTHAMGTAFSESNSYPDAPFELFPEEIPIEERRRREADVFAAYVCEYNTQLKKEEECDY